MHGWTTILSIKPAPEPQPGQIVMRVNLFDVIFALMYYIIDIWIACEILLYV